MIGIALLLAAVGLALSAFFSGSETGFYRVARMRLQLDALSGDRISRGLFWLTNYPSVFVATTLVGNNLANYLTSLAIVLGSQAVMSGPVLAAELLAPLIFAPVLFVYGELIPKYLFLRAPHRLLRRGGPLFLAFTVAFLPVSAVLWACNRLLALLVGESHETVQLNLARRELQRVLEEGHDAGILRPVQRDLARKLFDVAEHAIADYATPLHQVARARDDMSKAEVLRLARRLGVAEIPVEDIEVPDTLAGYVRVIDLRLDPADERPSPRPLMDFSADDTPLNALRAMQSRGERLARVVDGSGGTVGLITTAALQASFFERVRAPHGPSRVC